MSAPRRWKDSPDAPVGMRELLGSAKPSRPLDEATFKRGAERLARASVAPAAVAAIGIWTKLAAAGVVGLAAVGAVVAVGGHDEPVATAARSGASEASARVPLALDSARAAGSVELLIAPPSVPEPSASESRPPSSAIAAAAPVPRAPVPAAPKHVRSASIEVPFAATSAADAGSERVVVRSSLPEELTLLEDARRATARSPELALAALETHRARYPYGVLADERELMELDVLRRVGRVHDARSRAHAWLARDPNGMFAPRVRAILATLE